MLIAFFYSPLISVPFREELLRRGIELVNTPDEVKEYVRALLPKVEGHGGVAIGTGNQISHYTEPANWVAMTEAVREWRGEEGS